MSPVQHNKLDCSQRVQNHSSTTYLPSTVRPNRDCDSNARQPSLVGSTSRDCMPFQSTWLAQTRVSSFSGSAMSDRFTFHMHPTPPSIGPTFGASLRSSNRLRSSWCAFRAAGTSFLSFSAYSAPLQKQDFRTHHHSRDCVCLLEMRGCYLEHFLSLICHSRYCLHVEDDVLHDDRFG
jgi:hypothetical protein